ncbi:FdhD protein [Microbacterium terrae]|uniref:Sulfur carrier protein FdhD n=1 Tax=Microbacterium terrae TaxID=69369 RepID=A0A0M2H298_9MICO|nr:formate dehydrogenase accessory sulfurtransferase FdhD [Microbacterium terrae]KJL37693.1 Protein FdhD [Microbacterium terrae]MBP1076525.1 FdhD protein [Microbacterium terrae]GLJ97354.1 sulfurtransferase FdhD [Microbacterium terrae]
MGRLTVNRPVTRITLTGDTASSRRRPDTLVVEEPLEIRVGGEALAVTMRTPGHDVELATGFLVSEGVIAAPEDLRQAIHCAGPSSGPPAADDGNSYNVLDVTLAPGIPSPRPNRSYSMTSACGICGKDSIDEVRTVSRFDLGADATTVPAHTLAALPDVLRAQQTIFDKTGGLHAAALFDIATGELLVLREDVGRHNAVDKVVGWALQQGRLPLRATVLQVSGRASFELAQKAVMAGIPVLSAVSAPSSLAVELAAASGLTLVAFVRGASLNVYTGAERVTLATDAMDAGASASGRAAAG